jgi:tricorn protease
VSPTGRRAVFEARGDVVTLPAERGAAINVTRSSGVADRYPRWSPDGKTLAYWSDRSGEYELTFRSADGTGPERKATSLGRGFRYAPQWAPDNKKLAFIDQAMRIHVYDDATGKVTDVDKSPDWIAHDGLEAFRFQWSADSRWLAYARPAGTSNNAIFLFDTRAGKLQQATSGYLNDTQPTFDPDGKYLFYASDRAFDPVYGTFDNTWTYANPTQLVAVPLRADVASPLAARNDAENAPDAEKQKDGREARGAGRRRHRLRSLRAAIRRAPAEVWELRGSPRREGQAALPPLAARRHARREEPGGLLRSGGARGEDDPRRCGRDRGDVRRQEDARRQP